ncbi:unnamed protein product [Orchesella dallaii]|uniref:Uncharacterized protein n=1 Tax=Orchesella dallaii TaxID=48710 RepID=A0ABP1QZX4_9HEXA
MASTLTNAVACLSCNTCMDDMPYIVKPNKNGYSAETYVGNWYEDTCRNTMKRDEFLRKRECGDLKIQRTQTMIDLLLKPTSLTPDHDGSIHYGDTVQIVSPGPSCATAVQEHPFKRGHCRLGHLALSSSVPPSSIDHAPYLSTDSIISASPLLFPVVRNSFVIEHPTCPVGSGIGRAPVHYGDVFRIRALPTQHFKLYLFSAPAIRLHCASTHAAKPKVRFSDIPSTDTLWSAWPIDKFEELKMELGLPVPLKSRLYLKHNGTGINLSTEPSFPVLTYFGSELEVTCDTKRDRVRRPTYQNIWYFDTDRGIPRPDTCLKKFMDQSKLDASVNIHNIDKSAAEEEKAKEEAKKEAEGAYDQDDDDDNYMLQQQMQVRPFQFDPKGFRSSLREMDKSKDMGGGQMLHDPRTSPQPNAYAYKVFKDNPYYPNRKWNCGDTDCCNPRPPPAKTDEKGECCECVETEEPQPNPNVRVTLLKPLIR